MGFVDTVPLGQAAHTVSALFVPSVKILPAVHTVSGVQPGASLTALKFVPPVQSVQALSVVAVPAVETYVPGAQVFCALHAARLVVSLKVPVAHAEHT
jgi:hypothetical protein